MFIQTGRFLFPDWGNVNLNSTTLASNSINTTGHRLSYIGRVWSKDRTTKSIRKVGFRFGTVTKVGGSAMTLSLQDVSLTAGPPMQPDGVQDQTFAITNANALFATNTWFLSGNLSADRTVAHGELIAVVLEFDGAGRLGSDSVAVNYSGTVWNDHQISHSTYNGASWTSVSGAGVVLFEFSDGTFGTLASLNASIIAVNAYTHNSGTAGFDEYAIEFQLPWDCQIEGVIATVFPSTGSSDFTVTLMDAANTALATVTVDANALAVNTIAHTSFIWPPVNITKDTTYRISFRPTTANSITYYARQVADVTHTNAMPYGTNWKLAKRLDLGAWTTVATEAPMASLFISGFEIPIVDATSMVRIQLGM